MPDPDKALPGLEQTYLVPTVTHKDGSIHPATDTLNRSVLFYMDNRKYCIISTPDPCDGIPVKVTHAVARLAFHTTFDISTWGDPAKRKNT
jgi:hypothetical protein